MKTTVYCNGAQWCAKTQTSIITSNKLPQLMAMLFHRGYTCNNIEIEF